MTPIHVGVYPRPTSQNVLVFQMSEWEPLLIIYIHVRAYPRLKTSLFSDVRMGVSLDERHKARIERMMMEEEEEVKELEVSLINVIVMMMVVGGGSGDDDCDEEDDDSGSDGDHLRDDEDEEELETSFINEDCQCYRQNHHGHQ